MNNYWQYSSQNYWGYYMPAPQPHHPYEAPVSFCPIQPYYNFPTLPLSNIQSRFEDRGTEDRNSEKPIKRQIKLEQNPNQQKSKEIRKQVSLKAIQKGRNLGKIKQRKQKADRNLPSNAIKLFIKFLKKEMVLTIRNFKAICKKYNFTISQQHFFKVMDEEFPPFKLYFSPYKMVQCCKGYNKANKSDEFGRILAVMLQQFFSQNCYLLCSKQYNSNRRMLFKHIKAGKEILNMLATHY